MMNLLDFKQFDDPQQMGLLALAAGLMSPGRNPGVAGFGESLSNGLMSGMQGYTTARDALAKRAMAQAQMEAQKAQLDISRGTLDFHNREVKIKEDDAARKQKVLDQLQKDLQQYGLSGFTPEMIANYKVAGIDLSSNYKAATAPNGGTEYGLNPTIGIDPSTGKHRFFVPGKDGNPKWLDADVPPLYKVFGPTDYRGPTVVDSRNPGAAPPSVPMPGAQMAPQPGAQQAPGAPAQIPQPRPYAGVVSPGVRDRMAADEYKAGEKEISSLRQALQAHRAMLPEYEKFGELNRQNRTGGYDDLLGLSKVNPLTMSAAREMEGISSRLTPQQRPVGSGATSDFEQRLYRLGTVSIDNPGDTNQKIRKQFTDILKLGERELKFKEDWLQKYGTLNGATDAWAKVADSPQAKERRVVRRGMFQGRKVVQYSDGSTDYAD